MNVISNQLLKIQNANFKYLLVSGCSFTVNDYIDIEFTLAGDGQVKITVQGFFDVAIRQPKSFAAILDIVTV